MIVEKPMWLRHAGLQIFSLDVQPRGLRFATAGGDHKVRIWNMKPLGEQDSDSSASVNKLLATLRDHFGSVNCVRWAKCGRLIASGSDDQVILVHERRPGSGTTEFGSGEPPDVENWKVLLTLRGHTADVVDLGWSPDDTLLASCSLDNTVRVWQAATGSPVTVLTGHRSLVKGVTWDPIGSFLATQSDDKSVIIWRTSNWGLVQRVEGPYDKTVGSTFFRRLGWSPCGHFIATTHGFQNPSHTAPVLERGEWLASFDFVGHNAPVVAVRFNHSMFRKQIRRLPSDGKEGATDAGNGVAAGTVINGTLSNSKDALPYNVIAIGSQDCCISVWTTGSPRPVFIGKHFFTQSVVDLSWSPDGYTLFCCSLDGTVASFHFEAKELGQKISDLEMEEFKKSRYGDVRVRQVMLAESPAQLTLEAAAAKQWGSVNPPAKTAEPASAPPPPVVAVNGALGAEGAPKVAATEAASIPNGGGLVTIAPAKVIPSPVKQTEYRRPDGRRRIIPEPLGPPAGHEGLFGNGVMHDPQPEIPNVPTSDFRKTVDEKREDPGKAVVAKESDAEKKRSLPEECIRGVDVPAAKRSNNNTGAAAPAAHPSSGPETFAVGINSNPPASIAMVQQADMITPLERISSMKGVLSIRTQAPEDAVIQAPITLESRPIESSDNLGSIVGAGGTALKLESLAKAEVVCSQAGVVRWRDRLSSIPTALAGNFNFWAVACSDGTLQIYTMAGRRSQLSMMLGSPAAFMDCNQQDWRLLLVTKEGSLYLWDLQESKLLLHESLSPLLSPSSVNESSKSNGLLKVVSARLSRAGAPLVVLANQHAFLFHLNMHCWLRVADDGFPASNFVTTWPEVSAPAETGELALLQAGVTGAAGQNFIWNRSSLEEEKWQTRVHLEVQMSAAQALQSASEYRRFLLAYARCLAREVDEARLRELCEELLGPTYVVDSSSTFRVPSKHDKNHHWNPEILGMKKRELLKSEVLPAMASNRGVQRLLNEFVDLLSECEAQQQILGRQ